MRYRLVRNTGDYCGWGLTSRSRDEAEIHGMAIILEQRWEFNPTRNPIQEHYFIIESDDKGNPTAGSYYYLPWRKEFGKWQEIQESSREMIKWMMRGPWGLGYTGNRYFGPFEPYKKTIPCKLCGSIGPHNCHANRFGYRTNSVNDK